MPTQPKPGIFYALPKLHILRQLVSTKYNHSRLSKTLIDTEKIPQVANSLEVRPLYRPILSCKGTLTEHMLIPSCKFFWAKYPAFSKTLNDITHLVTPESLLVTMGVNSLHTNIPHSDGAEVCHSFLTMNTTDQTLINDIHTLVDIILKDNLFVFVDKQYQQINGTAMGKNGTNIRQYFYALR